MIARAFMIILGAIMLILPMSKTSYALCLPPECGCCSGKISSCQSHCACVSEKERGSAEAPKTTVGHITDEFKKHRKWMLDAFFMDNKAGDPVGLLAAMQLMTEQLTATAMQQTKIIGGFFDAKHQLETQREFQRLTARAHKDYHPSEGVCTIGTAARSLAGASQKTELTAKTLAKRITERQLLSKDLASMGGPQSDEDSRLAQYMKKYCNPKDNNKQLDLLCQSSEGNAALFNRDIDFASTIDRPLTIDIDFTQQGNNLTEDERAYFALTSNIFSNNVLPDIVASALENSDGTPNQNAVSKVYLDARALIAKRSVGANSFAAIAALKAQGNNSSTPFLYAILRELGGDDVTIDDMKKIVGDKPSYYAQMEILTQKLYQHPNFYVDLYDKPANVLRKKVAIQAATLMQKRDLYRSYLRSEMTLAVMLEAALMKEQERVTNEVLRFTPRERAGG